MADEKSAEESSEKPSPTSLDPVSTDSDTSPPQSPVSPLEPLETSSSADSETSAFPSSIAMRFPPFEYVFN